MFASTFLSLFRGLERDVAIGANPKRVEMRRKSLILLLIATLAILALDVVLALWVVQRKWFLSAGFSEYSKIVLDTFTQWTGRIVWIAGVFYALAVVIKNRRKTPQSIQPERKGVSEPIGQRVLTAIFDWLVRKPRALVGSLTVLLAVCPFLVWQLLEKPPYIPPGAPLLVTPDVATLWPPFSSKVNRKQIFLANTLRGRVDVFDTSSMVNVDTILRLGSGNTPGRPVCVAIAPRRGEIYAVDEAAQKVMVVDLHTKSVKEIPVGQFPRCIAITPDERKAYVSNELPIPQGSISVIDLETYAVVKTIRGVNCPEGLGVTPDGSMLYVASQCGAGQDPVFVIDTSTDEKIKSIPGFAVGGLLQIAPDGKMVLVARGNFTCKDACTGEPTVFANQLSIISAQGHTVLKSISFTHGIRAIAVTPDSKHFLIGTNEFVFIYDSKTLSEVNRICFSGAIRGIAISEEEQVYLWFPDDQQDEGGTLKVFGLSGLTQSQKCTRT